VLLLLLLLLGELESIVVGHLALHLGEGLVGELLLGLDHAQVNVLLVRCSNLLLLLLKEFDLLGESELLHCIVVSKAILTDEHGGVETPAQGDHVLIKGVSSEGLRLCAM